MTKQTDLQRALDRLQRKYPPKHPDRTKMRDYERQKANQRPLPVITNGYQAERPARFVDWDKQDRIPVGHVSTTTAGRRKKPDGSKNRRSAS